MSIHPTRSLSTAGWEYNMVRWLERNGYDVTYSTDIDTHSRPDFWKGHKAWLSVGHDEYWSDEMRRHVEAARDQGLGTRLPFRQYLLLANPARTQPPHD
jgi:hypothetical protein